MGVTGLVRLALVRVRVKIWGIYIKFLIYMNKRIVVGSQNGSFVRFRDQACMY